MTVELGGAVTDTAAGKDPDLAKKRGRLDPGQGRRAWLLVAPTLVALAVVIVYPICRAVWMSFQADKSLVNGVFVEGGWTGLTNYTDWIFQRCGDVSCPPGNIKAVFWQSVYQTFMFTGITVFFEIILGFWFAMIMNQTFRGRGLLRAAVLIPWAIPTAVTAKLWFFIFSFAGIANSLAHVHVVWFSEKWAARFAIIISDVWKTTPFMALLILAGLQLISADVYEAAKVDGASAYQRFMHITLPLVRPALMVAILFRTLDVLRMFDLPWIMTHGGGGGGNDTTTLSILVVEQMKIGINSAAALSTITFLIIFLVAFIFVKFLGANVVETQEANRRK